MSEPPTMDSAGQHISVHSTGGNMDAVLSFLGHVIKQFIFEFVFFWPGWLALKVLTLGRYPRLSRPSKHIEDYSEIAYFGVFVVLLLLAVFFKFFPA